MADLMAIVSKAVFEKEAGKSPSLGQVLGMDRYVTANKALAPLAEGGGGKLYLVTVRPPDEKLWLVAVLDKPKFDGKQWKSKPSTVAITDISKLKTKLKFESGKGITAAAGALGMSLQTPRALTANDVALLDGASSAGGTAPAPAPEPKGAREIKDAPSGVAPKGGARDALLEAVLADPESMEPRRVYADVLTAHNDRRGDYIMLELALAGRLSIRKRAELTAKRDELFKKYAKTWFPYKQDLLGIGGGFVHSVKGTFAAVNKIAPDLFAAEPVTFANLSFPAEDLPKVLKAPWLARLRHLTIRSTIKSEGFAQLVAHPNLQQLTALNVTDAGIKHEGIAALEGNLPNLKMLALTANPIGAPGIAALVRWTGLAHIETLYLSGCDLELADVNALLAVDMPRLERLGLRKNDLGDTVVKSFETNAKHLPALRFLELNRTSIAEAGLDKLVKVAVLELPALIRIDTRAAPANRNYVVR